MATRCKAVENFEGYGCVLREGHGGDHVFANDPVPAPPTRTEEPEQKQDLEVLQAAIECFGLHTRASVDDAALDAVKELRRLREQIETMRDWITGAEERGFSVSTASLSAKFNDVFSPERP